MKPGVRPTVEADWETRSQGALQSPEGLANEQDVLAGLLAYSEAHVTADRLLQQFPSIGHVVSAEPWQLETLGLTTRDIELLHLVQAAACHMARAAVRARPALSNSPALISYLQTVMGYEQVEHVRILFLDRRNRLIADEVLHRGSIDHTPVYPRDIMKRALILNASALICVHNHPSGDPAPSRDDIAMTRQVKAAADALALELHDHIVIGHGKHASFRTLGLL
jgi:DNA repair protein RadC